MQSVIEAPHVEEKDSAAPPPEPPLQELLRAARLLLKRRADLDAVRVIHAQIASTLNDAEGVVPERYASRGDAWRVHAQLRSRWQGAHPPTGQLEKLRERAQQLPPWSGRAAMAVVAVLLILRYTWAVSYGKNWARQNPEGNWISRFYANPDLQGFPMVRYDVGVNADFGADAPADAVKKDGFSARWDTCLVVTKDVVVPLTVTSDDGSKLFLGGQLQGEIEPGPGQLAISLALTPGVWPLRVEFVERGGMALIRVEGFDWEGTEAYSFRRPVMEGTELRCP